MNMAGEESVKEFSCENGNSKKVDESENSNSLQTIPIRLVSATYGPCDGRRLENGEWSNTESIRIPYTRDVLPFLQTLLLQARTGQQDESKANVKNNETNTNKIADNVDELIVENRKQENVNSMVSISNNSIVTTNDTCSTSSSHTPVPLIMEGKSMNAVFGDPCPGTTKVLRVQYYFGQSKSDSTHKTSNRSFNGFKELYRSTFYEHEEVVLKRKILFFQNDVESLRHDENEAQKSKLNETMDSYKDDDFMTNPIKANSLKYRTQSINEFETEQPQSSLHIYDHKNIQTGNGSSNHDQSSQSVKILLAIPTKKWRLRSATSEIVLPMILPYLPLLQRAQCQLVCKVWRFIVREWGITQVVDVNRCHVNFTYFSNSTNTSKNDSATAQNDIRSFLRGVISNSYSSLQSLFLNDYHQLTRDDFHPLIPRLKKLKRLDISRCKQLNNYSLILISQHLDKTLEMLYMKGLPNASDIGVKALASACTKLRVLEISNLKITDMSAFAIGNNLKDLQALYMRDNWKLTAEGVNCITLNCKNLTQLTLWGTVKMKSMGILSNMEGLVLLNLWGCHGLKDDCVRNFGGLKCLRSLIVSECHGLTDQFVIQLAHLLPHITYLHLRYLRHLTDASLNAISDNMGSIYSLDLSFCSKLTAIGLSNLIEVKGRSTLAELKLYNCTQLNLRALYQIVTKLVNGGSRSTLNMLDLRKCVAGRIGQDGNNEVVVVEGRRRVTYEDVKQKLKSMKFEEKVEGFWAKPAKWNENMRELFVKNMMK